MADITGFIAKTGGDVACDFRNLADKTSVFDLLLGNRIAQICWSLLDVYFCRKTDPIPLQ